MLWVWTSRTLAQEFAPVTPPAAACGAASLVDRGLPPSNGALQLETVAARPFGIAALDQAAAMMGWGARGARAAFGVARAGDAELGWNAIGVAFGWADTRAGCAVRALTRRDLAAALPGAGWGRPELGGEAGIGAWIAPGPAFLWFAGPQLVTAGAAPPLRRGPECGAAWRGRGASGWIVDESPPRTVARELWRAGIELGGPGIAAWAEARQGPWRAALGVRARAGPGAFAAEVEAHPDLGETVRLSLVVGGGALPGSP